MLSALKPLQGSPRSPQEIGPSPSRRTTAPPWPLRHVSVSRRPCGSPAAPTHLTGAESHVSAEASFLEARGQPSWCGPSGCWHQSPCPASVVWAAPSVRAEGASQESGNVQWRGCSGESQGEAPASPTQDPQRPIPGPELMGLWSLWGARGDQARLCRGRRCLCPILPPSPGSVPDTALLLARLSLSPPCCPSLFSGSSSGVWRETDSADLHL